MVSRAAIGALRAPTGRRAHRSRRCTAGGGLRVPTLAGSALRCRRERLTVGRDRDRDQARAHLREEPPNCGTVPSQRWCSLAEKQQCLFYERSNSLSIKCSFRYPRHRPVAGQFETRTHGHRVAGFAEATCRMGGD